MSLWYVDSMNCVMISGVRASGGEGWGESNSYPRVNSCNQPLVNGLINC